MNKQYYFNNTFKHIIKLKNKMEAQDIIDEDDMLELINLTMSYGIKSKKSEKGKAYLEKLRLHAIEEWLKFEYPNVVKFTDLQVCKDEKDLLLEIIKPFKERIKNQSIKREEYQEVYKQIVEVEETPTEIKMFLVGVPLGLFTLITLIANSVS